MGKSMTSSHGTAQHTLLRHVYGRSDVLFCVTPRSNIVGGSYRIGFSNVQFFAHDNHTKYGFAKWLFIASLVLILCYHLPIVIGTHDSCSMHFLYPTPLVSVYSDRAKAQRMIQRASHSCIMMITRNGRCRDQKDWDVHVCLFLACIRPMQILIHER